MAYLRNFKKIYVWQAAGILAGFASLFLVTPAISSNKEIFGIYSVCMSLTIFLSYTDLGFLGAGFKFAAEAFARGDRVEEARIVGFVVFLLGLLSLLFVGVVLVLAMRPTLIFPGLKSEESLRIASSLLLILAIAAVNNFWQRTLQLILGIRLEDYILRRFMVAASLLSIASILWFFRTGRQNIVGYSLFLQFTKLIASALVMILIAKRDDFAIQSLVRAVKFDREIFRKTKGLAVASLLGMLGWVVYYELDLLFISARVGMAGLALYSACFTIVKFVRSLLGVLYAPFQARFNHFVGLGNIEGLRSYYEKVVILTKPAILFSLCALFVLMEPFVIAWIGPEYRGSVAVGRILVCIYLFAYFQYPASVLLSAQQRLREINILTAVNVGVFWTGVFLTYKTLGIESLAIFKLVTFILSGGFYAFVTLRFLERRPLAFVWESYRSVVPPIAALAAILYFMIPYFPPVKSKLVMGEVALVGTASSLVIFIAFAFASKQYRTIVKALVLRKA